MQYATEKYNQNEQKQWTCDSIILYTENVKKEYIVDQVNQTTRTTGLGAIQQHTTETEG